MSSDLSSLLGEGVNLVVSKDGDNFLYNEKGITTLVRLLSDGSTKLRGARVADKIVGRAAALLMALGGVREVYAETLSKGAQDVFEKYAIPCAYGTLTENIINRSGTDICPMEKAVLGIDDPEEALRAVKAKLADMSK